MPSPAPADYNGDGKADFAVTGGSNARIFSGANGTVLDTAVLASPTLASVAMVGDVDGDGTVDYVTGSPYGMSGSGFFSLELSGGSYGSSNTAGGGHVGQSVSGIGDMNGDGISDLILADTEYNGSQARIDVLYGHAGAEADSYTVAGGVPAGYGFTIQLPTSSPAYFVGAGSAGDFDGDGFEDIAVGVRNGSTLDVYVVYGRAGLTGTITLDNTFLSNAKNVSWYSYDLTASGMANPSTNPLDLQLTSPGDMNGDGRDDLLIGMPHNNANDGEVIAVFGNNERGSTVAGQTLATAAGQALVGNASNNVLGDGGYGNVSISAGAGDDILNIGGLTPRSIDGGGGLDILQFTRSSSVLNFGAMGSEKLSGIERIIMAGTGQTLTLGIDDVFQLMQESVNGQLVIDSPDSGSKFMINDNLAGGTSTLNSTSMATLGFSYGGSTVQNSINYDVYNFGSGYQLLIDQNIATQQVI